MTAQATITRSAPGKLFITGEYAVMQPGTPAVLVAVDRLVTATVSAPDGPGIEVCTDLCPDRVDLHWHDLRLIGRTSDDDAAARGRLAHVVAAVEVVAELLTHRGLPTPSLHLTISSQLHDRGTKFGLGSSGAVTIAVIAAVTAFCGAELTLDDRFRLAMIASARLDADSSGADLAASNWRGWIVYQAPDRTAVLDIVQRHGIEKALRATWPGLAVRRLTVPPGLALEVGWTGSPASTRELVAGRSTAAWRGSAAHRAFVTDMTESVLTTVEALEHGDTPSVLTQTRSARRLLARLDKAATLGIFTDKLVALCDAADSVGWAAKPSGAGGGDCGVALLGTADKADITRLRERWADAGIQHLPLQVIGDEMNGQ